MAGDARAARAAIWDLPVRLFHWLLVFDLAALWWTGTQRLLEWHRLAGYVMTGLVLFRICWGVVGSSNARFSAFARHPRAVARYLRFEAWTRGSPPHAGHNPAGGWSVVAMLAILAVQVVLGMLSVDVDGLESGPFSYLVEFDTGRWAAQWHHRLFNVMLGLIVLHLAAIVYYLLYRRQNLVGPMIVGSRPWPGEMPQVRFAPLTRALGLAAAAGLGVYAVVTLFGRV